jgi:hypothetical protein
MLRKWLTIDIGILEAASDESSPNEDVDIWNVVCAAGILGFLDRKGPQQEW